MYVKPKSLLSKHAFGFNPILHFACVCCLQKLDAGTPYTKAQTPFTVPHAVSTAITVKRYDEMLAQFKPKPTLSKGGYAYSSKKFFGRVTDIVLPGTDKQMVYVQSATTGRKRQIKPSELVMMHKDKAYVRNVADGNWFKVVMNTKSGVTLRQVYELPRTAVQPAAAAAASTVQPAAAAAASTVQPAAAAAVQPPPPPAVQPPPASAVQPPPPAVQPPPPPAVQPPPASASTEQPVVEVPTATDLTSESNGGFAEVVVHDGDISPDRITAHMLVQQPDRFLHDFQTFWCDNLPDISDGQVFVPTDLQYWLKYKAQMERSKKSSSKGKKRRREKKTAHGDLSGILGFKTQIWFFKTHIWVLKHAFGVQKTHI